VSRKEKTDRKKMTEHSRSLSVVIVNYNSGGRLGRCLDCLAAQTVQPIEVIVFDNGSSDGSVDVARMHEIRPRVIASPDNLGFAAANNAAVKEANGDWVGFLNPDAYPEVDWLEQLLAGADAYPDAAAFGSAQIDANDPERLDGAGDSYHAAGIPYRARHGWPADHIPDDYECFAPCAAAAVYRRDVFVELGGFDEHFFCYCEDVDLAYRLRLSGGRAVQLSRARVLHEGSGITGRRSAFTVYHGHRNRIWTYVRNTPLALLAATAPLFLAANVYLIIRFAVSGDLGPYLRALRDGFAGAPRYWRERRDVLHGRSASLAYLATMMTWSPLTLMRRQEKFRTASLR
jgi:GT2 family glycosyltransferase